MTNFDVKRPMRALRLIHLHRPLRVSYYDRVCEWRLNFAFGDLDSNLFIVVRDFFLIGPITELSFDLNVGTLSECSSVMCQLAPDHDAVPFRAAVVSSRLVLPARFCGERQRRHIGAILQLSCFGIGTDKPDEIDVILEHCFVSFSFARFCRGTKKQGGRSPAEDDSFLEGDPNLCNGPPLVTL
jgi:hypothetical protein